MRVEALDPSVISGLDTFYEDYPLVFLGRDPSNQRLEKMPESLTSLRELLVTHDWKPVTEEQQVGMRCVNELYLIATGNFEGPSVFTQAATKRVEGLKRSHRMSKSSYGFLKECDPDVLYDSIKLTVDEVPNTSAHWLMQFCISKGVKVGHDTERNELCDIARWVIINENDGVSFKNMLEMMQQGIDLAVLGQHVERLEHSQKGDEVIGRLARKGVDMSHQMKRELGEVQKQGAALVVTATEGAQAKATAEFQAKVLQTLSANQARSVATANASDEQPQ